MRKRPTKEQFQHQLEQLANELRNEIIEGIYAPGEFLPSEKALVVRFGMSNNSIRAGLEQLVKEGWIEKIPRVGNRVAAGRPQVHLRLLTSTMGIRNLALSGLLDKFRAEYPWISVEIIFEVGPLQSCVEQGKWDCDLVMLDNYQFQQLVEAGLSSTLQPLPEHEEIYPIVSKQFRVDQHMCMRPLIFSPIVLCYNKQHFRDANLAEPDGSWTWDDLVRNAEKLSDGKGRYGFCFHLLSENRWPLFLLQSGERFEWETNSITADSLRNSKMMETIRLSKNIIHNRNIFPLFLSESNDDIDHMFLEGKISMTLNSYMGLNGLGGQLDYDISPVPYLDEPRTLLIALGLGMNAQTEHPEEARLFIDFLTSAPIQSWIREQTLSIPSLGTLPTATHEAGTNHPLRYLMYREVMGTCRVHADLGVPYKLLRQINPQLKAYWADLFNDDELCQRLETLFHKWGEETGSS